MNRSDPESLSHQKLINELRNAWVRIRNLEDDLELKTNRINTLHEEAERESANAEQLRTQLSTLLRDHGKIGRQRTRAQQRADALEKLNSQLRAELSSIQHVLNEWGMPGNADTPLSDLVQELAETLAAGRDDHSRFWTVREIELARRVLEEHGYQFDKDQPLDKAVTTVIDDLKSKIEEETAGREHAMDELSKLRTEKLGIQLAHTLLDELDEATGLCCIPSRSTATIGERIGHVIGSFHALNQEYDQARSEKTVLKDRLNRVQQIIDEEDGA